MNEEKRNKLARIHLKEELDNFERQRNMCLANSEIKKLKWRLKYNRHLDSQSSADELHKTYLEQITGMKI